MKHLIITLILIASTLIVQAHPFHVGVVEVSYNKELNRFECAVKLFTDDTERTLRNIYHKGVLDITGSNEEPKVDSLLADYLAQKVKIRVDQKPLEMHFLGKEGNADAIWTYIYFETPKGFSTFSVMASMLFELFDDQKNIVHWTTDEVQTFFISEDDPPLQLSL